MTFVTLCGFGPSDANCSYCLQMRDCRTAREAICTGCIRAGMCPAGFKAKRVEEGQCRGRELGVT